MASPKRTNFYDDKPVTLPRFVYRRLAQSLAANPNSRQQALASAVAELMSSQNPDVRKFKFIIPDFLRKLLSLSEASQFDSELSARKAHTSRLKMVFPHVSDEFVLNAEFLTSIFDLDHGPQIKAPGRFFTVGSCFARNIALYLANNGYAANTFELAEDLNSPISNAFIFDLINRSPQTQVEIIDRWLRAIFPESNNTEISQAGQSQILRLERLAAHLKEADCIVLTLGNVVDFFKCDPDPSKPLLDNIFPKFVAMPANEDISVRSGAASRLKSKGAVLRLASYGETLEAITGCIRGIRALTQVPIVVTLSPVPVDSVIGLSEKHSHSAIEVDCISKSRLRSAFHDAMHMLGDTGASIFYYPSFEIVRWVAPMLPIPTFGLDDAAARHVSSPILEAVSSLFLRRFIQLEGGDGKQPLKPHELKDAATSAFVSKQPAYNVTLSKLPTKS